MNRAIGTRFVVCIFIGVVGGLVNVSPAAYIIDADLNDWGVTAVGDWVAGSTADCIRIDNPDVSCTGIQEEFKDFETLYFDNDEDNFYCAVVRSYPLKPGYQGLDLGIDLNTDSIVSGSGLLTELELGIRTSSDPDCTLGCPVCLETGPTGAFYRPDEGCQGFLYRLSDGAFIGMAAFATRPCGDLEHGITIVEIAVTKNVLERLGANSLVRCHISRYCGNDCINPIGTCAVPEPATVALIVLGAAFLRPRRKKQVPPRPA